MSPGDNPRRTWTIMSVTDNHFGLIGFATTALMMAD
jgi:hypothetical protein